MEEIKDTVFNSILKHIEMKPSGALLITGDWGSGKTYYFKEILFKELKKEKKKSIMVSLFGINDLKDIPERVLFEYLDTVGDSEVYGKMAKLGRQIASSFPVVKKYINIDKLLGSGEGLYKIIPKDILICFDDIERADSSISINKILGVINELVENKGYTVIAIANEQEIKEKENYFKEKVIEKTVRFEPNIPVIFKAIVESHINEKFNVFMNCETVHKSINPNIKNDSKSTNSELKKNLSNIRTLKFAIKHFYYVFDYLTKSSREDIDPITTNKLINYWSFILAISIEYKNNHLFHEDNRSLDSYHEVTNFDIDLDDDEPVFDFEKKGVVGEEEKEKIKAKAINDNNYSQLFFKTYFSRISVKPIYHAELYNFVIAGADIDYIKLDKNVIKELNVIDNNINPAHELLDQYLRNNWWAFSNLQCKENVKNLLNYVKEAKLDDYISYINASIYLINLNELLDMHKDDITTIIKNGINKFTQGYTLNHLTKVDLEIIKSQLTLDILPIYNYIIELIDEKMNTHFEDEKKGLKLLFQTNMQNFASKILHKSLHSAPQYWNIPILNDINQEDVEKALENPEPFDLMHLKSLIHERYCASDYSLDEIKEEITFLNLLNDALKTIDITEKTASNIIIRDFLLPIVEKAVKIIEQVKERV